MFGYSAITYLSSCCYFVTTSKIGLYTENIPLKTALLNFCPVFTFFERSAGIYEILILASVSFWPLVIIESVARVSQHMLLTHDLHVKQVYNVKGELDCLNCKTGVFLSLFTSMFTKESNYNPRFCEKTTRLWGIFNIYKGKLSVPRVHTAA